MYPVKQVSKVESVSDRYLLSLSYIEVQTRLITATVLRRLRYMR